MTNDELRALADALDHMIPMTWPEKMHDMTALIQAAAYLRAQADAQPVAWIGPSRPKIDGADHRVLRQDYDASHGYGWSRDTAKANGFLPLYTHPAPAPSQAEPSAALIRAYNSGYMQGHHDTVESCFTDIHQSDMDTFHADLVAELGLSAAPQAEPKREPLSEATALIEWPESAKWKNRAAPEGIERSCMAEPKREPACLWSRADDDTDVWETKCGHAFTIIDGTPTDNQMAFCCYCGRRVDEEIGGSDE